MKLCCIYVVWDDWDLLDHSIKHMTPLVDEVIIIVSNISNYGEEGAVKLKGAEKYGKVRIYLRDPDLKLDPRTNETAKRNYGLQKASDLGHTHFLMMDADEFYEPEPFLKEKQRFTDNPNLAGLVCRTQVYFKSPALTIGLDTTLVPFIHKLTPGLQHEFNRKYPYAWTDQDGKPFTDKKRIRIDPTRSLNINSGVEWSDIIMHHYSYVRRDLQKKIRNSTARENIQNSTLVHDFKDAKEGQLCQFYNKKLARCPNLFGLPEMK